MASAFRGTVDVSKIIEELQKLIELNEKAEKDKKNNKTVSPNTKQAIEEKLKDIKGE